MGGGGAVFWFLLLRYLRSMPVLFLADVDTSPLFIIDHSLGLLLPVFWQMHLSGGGATSGVELSGVSCHPDTHPETHQHLSPCSDPNKGDDMTSPQEIVFLCV